MPAPSTPPFAPAALTYPRQLQRWLDTNYQGGALTRAGTFLTLPALAAGNTWNGYSDIVMAFNFEGPNNFSLTNMPLTPNPVTIVIVNKIVRTVTQVINPVGTTDGIEAV